VLLHKNTENAEVRLQLEENTEVLLEEEKDIPRTDLPSEPTGREETLQFSRDTDKNFRFNCKYFNNKKELIHLVLLCQVK
jgi:hypothetical protein